MQNLVFVQCGVMTPLISYDSSFIKLFAPIISMIVNGLLLLQTPMVSNMKSQNMLSYNDNYKHLLGIETCKFVTMAVATPYLYSIEAL